MGDPGISLEISIPFGQGSLAAERAKMMVGASSIAPQLSLFYEVGSHPRLSPG